MCYCFVVRINYLTQERRTIDMKLTKMIIGLFVVCLFFATQTACAITFDFAAAIDSGGYTGTIKMKKDNESTFSTLGDPTGELGGTVFTWLQDGVTLTATSSGFVCLDYNHAGMGVVNTRRYTECL